MAVPGVVEFSVERDSPGLHQPYPRAAARGCLNQNSQSGEVVPAMDCDAISVEYGVKTDCVGHINRRGAFQRTWGPAGPPLPGVWRLCFTWFSAWAVHDRTVVFH